MNVLKAIGILAMGLLLTLIVFPWMDALRDTVYHPVTPTPKQYVSTGDDTDMEVEGVNWSAQAFTVTSSYTLAVVKVKVWATGTGTLTVAVYDADGSGYPTGAALATGTLAASSHSGSSPGAFATATCTTPLAVTAGVYDVVLHYAGSGVVNWRAMGGDAGYCFSTDGGSTWGD